MLLRIFHYDIVTTRSTFLYDGLIRRSIIFASGKRLCNATGTCSLHHTMYVLYRHFPRGSVDVDGFRVELIVDKSCVHRESTHEQNNVPSSKEGRENLKGMKNIDKMPRPRSINSSRPRSTVYSN